jgi:hypothetical protein
MPIEAASIESLEITAEVLGRLRRARWDLDGKRLVLTGVGSVEEFSAVLKALRTGQIDWSSVDDVVRLAQPAAVAALPASTTISTAPAPRALPAPLTEPVVVVPPEKPAGPAHVMPPGAHQPRPSAAPPAEREPGSDDIAEDDQVFLRCSLLKETVKILVERGLKDPAPIVAELRRLRDAGAAPVLRSIPDDSLEDRVGTSLLALGVG